MITRVPARLLLAVVLPMAPCDIASADAPPRPVARVALAPVVTDKMSGLAWRAMTEECNSIWAREGIVLSWSATVAAHVALPLVFDDRAVRRHDPKAEDAFGVTLFAGRAQRILVSISRARRVVERHKGLADSGDGMMLDIAMGILLGRVVAHEIGHALLLTTRHAEHGLMRPRFDAGGVRPDTGIEYALSPPERQRLAVRFSNAPAPDALVLAGFTWMDAPPAPFRPHAPR